MVKLPRPDEREVIARAPFLDESIGEMVAKLDDHEGPVIDVRIAPDDTGQEVTFVLAPLEARTLAAELDEIAITAQRAGWTPAVIAHTRDTYLPDATDAEIMTRLDRLVERLDGTVLGHAPGTLHRDAGAMLVADAHLNVVERTAESLESTIDQLALLTTTVTELRRIYRTESTGDQP